MRDLSIKARGGPVFEAEWAHTQGQARIVLGQGAGETVAGGGEGVEIQETASIEDQFHVNGPLSAAVFQGKE